MKTFRVQAPDGRTLNVQGEDAEGAALAAEEYVKANPLNPATEEAHRRSAATAPQHRALVQGITFGFGDELAAGAANLGTKVANLGRSMTGRPLPYTSQQMGDAMLDSEREAQAQFGREHPMQNLGLQVAGGFMTPGGAAAKFVTRGGTMGARMGRSALVGAGFGGASGAGNAKGGVAERAKGAAAGAALGATVGAGVPVVGAVVRGAGRVANVATGQRMVGPAQSAAARLRQALHQDGVGEAEINTALADWERSGASAPTLMDLAGENTRALLRLSASKPGPARNQAVQYAKTTRENLQGRAIDRARKLTPNEPRPAAKVKESLEQEQRVVDDQSYPAFQDEVVPVGSDLISAVSGETGADALAYAARVADANRDVAALQEIAALRQGKLDRIRGGTLDLIRRGLRDKKSAAFSGNEGSIGRGIGDRQADVTRSLDYIPEAAEARNLHRHYSQRIEAVDQGGGLLSATPDEFAAGIGSMDAEMLEAARVGGRQALTNALGQPANASPVLNKVAWSENAQRNLESLYGPDEAKRFVEAARNELMRRDNANFISPNTGSQTGPRAQDERTMGDILSAIRQPLSAIISKLTKGLTLTDADREVLLQLGLEEPRAAMQRLQPPPAIRMIGSAEARAPSALASGAVGGLMTGAR